MRTIISVDDALYQLAVSLADTPKDRANIIRAALQTFVRIQTAKRAASLRLNPAELPSVPEDF